MNRDCFLDVLALNIPGIVNEQHAFAIVVGFAYWADIIFWKAIERPWLRPHRAASWFGFHIRLDEC